MTIKEKTELLKIKQDFMSLFGRYFRAVGAVKIDIAIEEMKKWAAVENLITSKMNQDDAADTKET
jgi:hypothetical protein